MRHVLIAGASAILLLFVLGGVREGGNKREKKSSSVLGWPQFEKVGDDAGPNRTDETTLLFFFSGKQHS